MPRGADAAHTLGPAPSASAAGARRTGLQQRRLTPPGPCVPRGRSAAGRGRWSSSRHISHGRPREPPTGSRRNKNSQASISEPRGRPGGTGGGGRVGRTPGGATPAPTPRLVTLSAVPVTTDTGRRRGVCAARGAGVAASATSAQSPTQGAAGPGGRGQREVGGVPRARGSPGRHARQSHSETRDPPQVAHGSSPAEAVDGSPGVTGKGPPLPGAVGTLTRVSRRGWSDGRTAGHEAHAAQSGGGAVGTGSGVGTVRATRPPVSLPCAGGSKLSGRADGVSVPAPATDRA